MSGVVDLRAALESTLAAMTPAIDTAWENDVFNPRQGQPYQQINMLLAAPENPTFGDGFFREMGFLQVTLAYPINTGSAAAMAQAQAIRDAFPRGKSMRRGGVTVIVYRTAEIKAAYNDGDRYFVPVRVPFYANVMGENILLTEQGGYLTT